MFRYIITLLMFCCLSLQVQAQVVELNKNHPNRHIVVKNDTLWGISGDLLNNPWLWLQVWELNRDQIKNPHFIYPSAINHAGKVIQDPDPPKLTEEQIRAKANEKPEIKALNFNIPRDEESKVVVNFERTMAPSDAAPEADILNLPNERPRLPMAFRVFDHVQYALSIQAYEPVNVLESNRLPKSI
ncbi:MAG: hypothetical protein FJY53_05870 [Betaproteobacteria bacterium]|nr:hypothetical protein [Betaproteobacteria bacterium]